MARRYRDKSVAEQNSLDIAWDALMMPQFRELRQIIFETKEELMRFIFELREQGMAVTTTMVMFKACQIVDGFNVISREAQYNCTRRFVKSVGLVYRMGTHESQKARRKEEGRGPEKGQPHRADRGCCLGRSLQRQLHLVLVAREAQL